MCKILLLLLLAMAYVVQTMAAEIPPVLHYTIERRGGAFPTEQVANFTFLTAELQAAEARFNLTRREMQGNKVVRKPKDKGMGGGDSSTLMGQVGKNGTWYCFSRHAHADQHRASTDLTRSKQVHETPHGRSRADC